MAGLTPGSASVAEPSGLSKKFFITTNLDTKFMVSLPAYCNVSEYTVEKLQGALKCSPHCLTLARRRWSSTVHLAAANNYTVCTELITDIHGREFPVHRTLRCQGLTVLDGFKVPREYTLHGGLTAYLNL